MPTQEQVLATMYSQFAFAEELCQSVYADKATAQGLFLAGDYRGGGVTLCGAVATLTQAVQSLIWDDWSVQSYMMIPYFLEHFVAEAGAVDMDALINAMLLADPNQVQYFVGLVDAFRQSVWNMPFNKEFYAALARGFTQWP